MKIDWNNLYKIRLASSDKSFEKHEIVKLLLVMKILNKYRRRDWLRVYTEFELDNGLKPDVYMEHIKDKSIVIYEIQKDYTDNWLEKKKQQYENYNVPYFNSIDFVPIPLEDFSDDINEISIKLDEFVF